MTAKHHKGMGRQQIRLVARGLEKITNRFALLLFGLELRLRIYLIKMATLRGFVPCPNAYTVACCAKLQWRCD